VENIAICQNVQTFFSHTVAHKLCAQSSITKTLLDLAQFVISSIFAGFQKVCWTIIAKVELEKFFLIDSSVMFKVSSISVYIGLRSACFIALTTDTHV